MHPEIILGPPGTGKTNTLLLILEQELQKGVPPDRIGFVSFTRRATEEAISRSCEKFNLMRSSFPHFRTIHSLAFRQLGLKQGEVFEGSRLKEFAAWAKISVTGRYTEDGSFSNHAPGDKIIFLDNLARVKGIPLQELYKTSKEELLWSEVQRVVRSLNIFKREYGLIDFTEMLQQFINVGPPPKLDLLLCDEVQDQSSLQWQVIEKLAKNTRRVVLAGDDDQSIYEWSGADIPRMVNQPGNVRVLTQSYRVPQTIQTLANKIIHKVKLRRTKNWSPRAEQGKIDYSTNFSTLSLDGDDILILSRNSYLIDNTMVPELRQRGVFFHRNGIPSIKQSIIDAIMSWETLRKGDFISLSEALNVYDYLTVTKCIKNGYKKLPGFNPSEPINLGQLRENGGLLIQDDLIWHEALDRIPHRDRDYIISCRRRGEKFLKKPRVRLSTVHSIKGGQGDHVILFSEMATRTFKEMDTNPDAEARVAYVAVTRAKHQLTIVDSTNEHSYRYF